MKLRWCSLLIMILMLLVGNNITTASAQPQAMKDVGQSSVVGEWVGGTDALGTWRFIQARFARDARGLTGSLDAQSANVMRLPLSNVKISGSDLRFELPTPLGLYAVEAQIKEGRITGLVTAQSGAKAKAWAGRKGDYCTNCRPGPNFLVADI